jgi:uncharacterized protein
MSENTAAEQARQTPENGAFCWTEFATDDLAACQTFYAEVFGWQFKKSDATGMDLQYLEFGTDPEKPFGGLFEMKAEWYGGELPKPHSSIYIAVDDADAVASQAFELGATIVSPPCDVPNVGRIAVIEDPTGGKFCIIKFQR